MAKLRIEDSKYTYIPPKFRKDRFEWRRFPKLMEFQLK